MQIELKGRNTIVTDELRQYVERRFEKISKMVYEHARLVIEVHEERNPAIRDSQVANATIYLKGKTLHVSDRSTDMQHAVHLCSDELERQVQKHRAKRWHLKERRRVTSMGNKASAAM